MNKENENNHIADDVRMISKDTAYKIVAEVLHQAEDRDDDFALTVAIVDALWERLIDGRDDG